MKKTLTSPLVAAANNIVSLGSRSNSLPRFQRDFNSFSRFLEVENRSLEKLKLPDKKKIKALASLNIASNFGRPGNLLGSLFSGALDLAGFVGNMFPGRGKLGKPQRPSNVRPPKPTIKGPRLKLGGMRAVGVGNALFAGLDFATGLAEGESVGKAAAGAGGALAGSLLGGAIGQALIPIPGLGFVVGSMAGSFLGGYTADRVYEGGSALKQKLAERLKGQEGKQKGIASGLAFKDTIDKFDAAVSRFERGVAMGLFGSVSQQTEQTEQPTGYDEELSADEMPTPPEGTPQSGEPTGPVSYGSGNAEFGETGNVSNSAGWVHGHFQGSSAGSVVRDTTMTVKALLQQGSPVYLNPGVDLLPGKKYSDDEIRKYVEGARKAHTHSGTGKSIDVFVRKGTKVPVSLSEVKPTGSDYGGFGRGGNAGYIQGTDTWIGHLTPNSKSGLAQKKGEIKGTEAPNMDLGTQDKNKPQQQQATQAPTTQSQVAASPQMMQVPQMSSMVAAAPMNLPVAPQNIQYYTSYNQPGGGASVIMPIMMGGGGGGQRPVYIPVGGGGGTVIMPGPTEGQVVNSLMKTMLLTNLSAT
jgi:hypothetical protein